MCKSERSDKYSLSTFTKQKFNYLTIEENEVFIEDIAWALSNEPRYAGHRDFLYSVGEHSLLVAEAVLEIVERNLPAYRYEATYAALLHDGSEAYMKDLPTPLKILLPDYKALERRVQQLINRQMRVYEYADEQIKQALESAVAYCDMLIYNLECEAFDRHDEKEALGPLITEEINAWDLSCSIAIDRVEGKHPTEVAEEFFNHYKYLQWRVAEERKCVAKSTSRMDLSVLTEILEEYLQYMNPEDTVFRRGTGETVSIEEMLFLIRNKDPIIDEFVKDVLGAAVRAIRVKATRSETRALCS